MVVDDEEFCITSINALFEILEIDSKLIDSCMQGQEALDKIKEAYNHGITYKVIFMDFSMPILDGLEASIQLREFFI